MRLIPSLLVAALFLSLTACSPFSDPYVEELRDGGTTPAAAEELIGSIEGVSAVDYQTIEWYSPGEGGLFSSSGMSVLLNVTIDPQYSIADPAGWLEFLAATAWSVNDHYPVGDVVIALTGGADRVFDWTSVARDVFDDDELRLISILGYEVGSEVAETAVPIAVGTATYGRVFGRWPSEPVPLPAGLLANVPPTITIVPAINELNTYLQEDPAEREPECIWVSFRRGEGGMGAYLGDVSVTVLDADQVEVESEVVSDNSIYADFCYPIGQRPEDPSVRVVTEPAEGFSDVDLPLVPRVLPED